MFFTFFVCVSAAVFEYIIYIGSKGISAKVAAKVMVLINLLFAMGFGILFDQSGAEEPIHWLYAVFILYFISLTWWRGVCISRRAANTY